ncbi:heptaprenyl diphosphate synthase component 1 [Alkalihalobacillus sp. 1P02AB]|uniref:heptaprenyl diphosphate synthase component 1 n=1 Tax=Alkalihalobacillus sp. 1P02AB TaxID=3132260 RepID=UPI0039A6A2BA
MVSKNELNEILNDIKKSFNDLTKHTYLERHIEGPIIDEDKIIFLYAMLSSHLSNKDVKMIILSAMLLQAALDVHEDVTLHKIKSDAVIKERQLTVLAGDYYSSLYYYLLAKAQNVPMIRIFSRSIQEINECKMNLYKNSAALKGYKKIENEVISVESKLLQNIAEHFDERKWLSLFKEFFLLKRLLIEQKAWKNGKRHALIQSLLSEHPDDAEDLMILEEKVEVLKDKILQMSQSMATVERIIVARLEGVLQVTVSPKKVAEEG